jgi:hypothetical protein
MKRISILFAFVIAFYGKSFSQYIGVKCKYTDSRLVPNPGFPDSRENKLILCFYSVDLLGVWTPISMTNYDMYVKAGDVQVTGTSSVIDSAGANYPGYAWTAPVVASYYNSLGREYFDCGTYGSVHLVANGHELDCGYLKVSEWMLDYQDNPYEQFTTIEVGLPFYVWPDPFFQTPGNVNFGPYGTLGSMPYNLYNFSCGGSLQLVNRGLMWSDSTVNLVVLPIHFANLHATIDGSCKATIYWSNLTESDISQYNVERSVNNGPFQVIDSVLPLGNTGGRFDYSYSDADSISAHNLYRIKAIETTGNFYYSLVLRINGCRGGRSSVTQPKIMIYPNPSQNGRFVLSATDLPRGKYDVVIVSTSGRQTMITTVDHSGGALNKLFEVSWVTPGMYTIVLRSTELNLTQKIMIND